MDGLGVLWVSIWQTFIHLWIHPFFYVGILLIILQYRRQIYLERKLFHTKLHHLWSETWRTVCWGLVGGIVASVFINLIGVLLTPHTVYWIWGISLLLVMFRMRFLCLSYATGILAILQYLSLLLTDVTFPYWINEWFQQMMASLQAIKISSLLVLVAILHLVEALYIRFQGHRMLTPLFLEGKRGKVVGGYQLQGFWPVPLFLLFPLSEQWDGSWFPWFNDNFWQSGWQMAILPTIIGFMDLTKTMTPRQKLIQSSNRLMLYSVAVLALAALSQWQASLALLAGMLCLILHEALMYWSYRSEERGAALFVHDPPGLRVLGVIPGSPAAKLNILPGERITRVNGKKIATKRDLHDALRMNAAFCKLEVLDLNGEIRFLNRAVFAGDRYQLGILLSPDDDALYYLEFEQPKSIFSYVHLKLSGLFRNGTSMQKMKG